tara:strand:- start:7110 stop:7817 length:708 start_codon:yes stop_codon:yes gene_type:complete
MKFLILGNDPSLGLVNWNLVRDSSLFVVGINRSYMLYPDHDMLFIQDPLPILELLDSGYCPEELMSMNIHTTAYFKKRMLTEKNKSKMSKEDYTALVDLLRDGVVKIVPSSFTIKSHSPFSIPNAISYCFDFFKERITEAGKVTFYLCGCGLKHRQDNNHFWQNSEDVRFPQSSPGGSSVRQLNRQLLVMNNLRSIYLAHDVNVVSCNVDSRLNNIFPYEPLRDVLLKNKKINHD